MQLLDVFYRDMVHFILIMMSLPGPPACAGIFDNPGCFGRMYLLYHPSVSSGEGLIAIRLVKWTSLFLILKIFYCSVENNYFELDGRITLKHTLLILILSPVLFPDLQMYFVGFVFCCYPV